MNRFFARAVKMNCLSIRNIQPKYQTRLLSEDKISILSEKEQSFGRRKEELESLSSGGEGFFNSPIIPADDAGTKEYPILVPSEMHSRAVGYEDPLTHQLVWFNLNAGKLHFIPSIGLYFMLYNINDGSIELVGKE